MTGPILVAGARDQRRGSAIPASSITQKQQPLTPLQADPPAPGRPPPFLPTRAADRNQGAGGGAREQGTTEEEMKGKKGEKRRKKIERKEPALSRGGEKVALFAEGARDWPNLDQWQGTRKVCCSSAPSGARERTTRLPCAPLLPIRESQRTPI